MVAIVNYVSVRVSTLTYNQTETFVSVKLHKIIAFGAGIQINSPDIFWFSRIRNIVHEEDITNSTFIDTEFNVTDTGVVGITFSAFVNTHIDILGSYLQKDPGYHLVFTPHQIITGVTLEHCQYH